MRWGRCSRRRSRAVPTPGSGCWSETRRGNRTRASFGITGCGNDCAREGWPPTAMAGTGEERIDGGGGLKFFGAMAFSMDSVTSVVKVLHEESTACVALLPSRIDPRGFLRAGWRGDRPFDERLLEGIASTGGVMCAAVGRFDDPRTGRRRHRRQVPGARAARRSGGEGVRRDVIDEELVREIAEAAALASIRELGEPDAARVTASLGRTFVGSGADGRWWCERSIGRTVVLPYGDRDGLSILDALLEGEASVVMIPTDDEPPPLARVRGGRPAAWSVCCASCHRSSTR